MHFFNFLEPCKAVYVKEEVQCFCTPSLMVSVGRKQQGRMGKRPQKWQVTQRQIPWGILDPWPDTPGVWDIHFFRNAEKLFLINVLLLLFSLYSSSTSSWGSPVLDPVSLTTYQTDLQVTQQQCLKEGKAICTTCWQTSSPSLLFSLLEFC